MDESITIAYLRQTDKLHTEGAFTDGTNTKTTKARNNYRANSKEAATVV